MTKEERKKAIEVLDDMKVKIDIPKAAKTQNDRNWALDVAIQALSQEPTEKPMTVDEMEREYEKSKALFHKIVEYDDAISREAVKEIINDIRDCISVEGYCAILERLKKLPYVNPQPICEEREKGECPWYAG